MTKVFTQQSQFLAVRTIGCGDIFEYRICSCSPAPQRACEQISAVGAGDWIVQIRQGGDLFGITDQDVGQIFAGLEKRKRAYRIWLIPDNFGIALRACERRTQETEEILASVRA